MDKLCKHCAESQFLQGWRNYPTWAVAVSWQNDEWVHGDWLDLAISIYRDTYETNGCSKFENSVYLLGKRMKQHLQEYCADDLPTPLPDLIENTIERVDFKAIAESYLQEAMELHFPKEEVTSAKKG